MLGKHASWKRDRGFKSHPLRQTWRDRYTPTIKGQAVARQTYQQAVNDERRKAVSLGATSNKVAKRHHITEFVAMAGRYLARHCPEVRHLDVSVALRAKRRGWALCNKLL